MRLKWRGLELPSHVHRDEAASTRQYGRFIIEPFEQGFGTTIGNSLRRVLLSSLEGAAVVSVKIAGAAHEFTSIEGVLEDVTEIILNIKGIVLSLDSDETKTLTVRREKAGVVKAGDIVTDPAISILNPEHLLATLTSNVSFQVDMVAQGGRGFATANDNRSPEQELGVIPIDSVFSPVVRVRYRTENMRVEQKTDYDRLILEVWTNGTIDPSDALVEAGLILRKHLNPFVLYHDLGLDEVSLTTPLSEARIVSDSAIAELLDKPVTVLNLSVRSSNCLEAGNVRNIGQLVQMTTAELLELRSFGKTSLHEVQRKLADAGLQLGMKIDSRGTDFGSDSSPPSPTEPGPFHSGAPTGPMEVFTMGE